MRIRSPFIHPQDDSQKSGLIGLFRTLVANMVKGVSEGFERVLEIQGVGYRAEVQDNLLVLNLGYSHPVPFQLPEGISAQVERQTRVVLRGIDRDLLGLTARIRKFRPQNPIAKGIKYQRKSEGRSGKPGQINLERWKLSAKAVFIKFMLTLIAKPKAESRKIWNL
jgi:large subunit ribosomal protein L6